MDPMMQAQAQAWTVGGAVLGTLIGVVVGLTWFALTRKKSSAKDKDRDIEEETLPKVPKKEKHKKKVADTEEPLAKHNVVEQPQVQQPQVKQSQVQEPVVIPTQVIHKGPIRILLTDLDASHEIIDAVVEDQLVLGRHPERAQIVVADHTVSGVHCKFYNTNGKLFLADLASTNGTYVNGIKVDKIMTLSNKDILKIGQKSFEISY